MYWYKSMPDSIGYEDYKQERSKKTNLIRRSFVRYFFAVIFAIFLYLIYSSLYYIDPLNSCYIRIRYDVLKGDQESIKNALKTIKRDDFVLYKGVCRYVDTIYEKKCVEPQEKNYMKLKYSDSSGCFIKSSNAIMIEPVGENNYQKDEKRLEDITKYGKMAVDYWIYGKTEFSDDGKENISEDEEIDAGIEENKISETTQSAPNTPLD